MFEFKIDWLKWPCQSSVAQRVILDVDRHIRDAIVSRDQFLIYGEDLGGE